MKKPWYFYVIIALSIFATICGVLLVPFFILWNVDESEGKNKLINMYCEFNDIEFANEFYCVAKDNYVSYNHQIIHMNSLLDEKDDKRISSLIPNEFLPYTSLYFEDYVYSTSDFLFFSCSVHRENVINFLIFKMEWGKKDEMSFVTSLNLELLSAPIFYNYDKSGCFFAVKNNKLYDTYYLDIEKCIFYYLQTIDNKPEHASSMNTENGQIKDNVFEIMLNDKYHTTSFIDTCRTPYEMVTLYDFKPDKSLQLGNHTLCIYRYDTSFTHNNSVLAVFSYDWHNDIEKFQGIYTVYGNGYYSFYPVH